MSTLERALSQRHIARQGSSVGEQSKGGDELSVQERRQRFARVRRGTLDNLLKENEQAYRQASSESKRRAVRQDTVEQLLATESFLDESGFESDDSIYLDLTSAEDIDAMVARAFDNHGVKDATSTPRPGAPALDFSFGDATPIHRRNPASAAEGSPTPTGPAGRRHSSSKRRAKIRQLTIDREVPPIKFNEDGTLDMQAMDDEDHMIMDAGPEDTEVDMLDADLLGFAEDDVDRQLRQEKNSRQKIAESQSGLASPKSDQVPQRKRKARMRMDTDALMNFDPHALAGVRKAAAAATAYPPQPSAAVPVEVSPVHSPVGDSTHTSRARGSVSEDSNRDDEHGGIVSPRPMSATEPMKRVQRPRMNTEQLMNFDPSTLPGHRGKDTAETGKDISKSPPQNVTTDFHSTAAPSQVQGADDDSAESDFEEPGVVPSASPSPVVHRKSHARVVSVKPDDIHEYDPEQSVAHDSKVRSQARKLSTDTNGSKPPPRVATPVQAPSEQSEDPPVSPTRYLNREDSLFAMLDSPHGSNTSIVAPQVLASSKVDERRAAVTIQKVHRGRQGRKRVQQLRAQRENQANAPHVPPAHTGDGRSETHNPGTPSSPSPLDPTPEQVAEEKRLARMRQMTGDDTQSQSRSPAQYEDDFEDEEEQDVPDTLYYHPNRPAPSKRGDDYDAVQDGDDDDDDDTGAPHENDANGSNQPQVKVIKADLAKMNIFFKRQVRPMHIKPVRDRRGPATQPLLVSKTQVYTTTAPITNAPLDSKVRAGGVPRSPHSPASTKAKGKGKGKGNGKGNGNGKGKGKGKGKGIGTGKGAGRSGITSTPVRSGKRQGRPTPRAKLFYTPSTQDLPSISDNDDDDDDDGDGKQARAPTAGKPPRDTSSGQQRTLPPGRRYRTVVSAPNVLRDEEFETGAQEKKAPARPSSARAPTTQQKRIARALQARKRATRKVDSAATKPQSSRPRVVARPSTAMPARRPISASGPTVRTRPTSAQVRTSIKARTDSGGRRRRAKPAPPPASKGPYAVVEHLKQFNPKGTKAWRHEMEQRELERRERVRLAKEAREVRRAWDAEGAQKGEEDIDLSPSLLGPAHPLDTQILLSDGHSLSHRATTGPGPNSSRPGQRRLDRVLDDESEEESHYSSDQEPSHQRETSSIEATMVVLAERIEQAHARGEWDHAIRLQLEELYKRQTIYGMNSVVVAEAELDISWVYLQQGHPSQALHHVTHARDIIHSIQNEFRARGAEPSPFVDEQMKVMLILVHSYIGRSYIKLGDLSEAAVSVKRATDLTSVVPDAPQTAIPHVVQAELSVLAKRYAQARRSIHHTMALLERDPESHPELIGELYVECARLEQMMPKARGARTDHPTETPADEALVHAPAAATASKNRARQHLESAHRLYDKCGVVSVRAAQTAYALGLLATADTDFVGALEFYASAARTYVSLFGVSDKRSLRTMKEIGVTEISLQDYRFALDTLHEVYQREKEVFGEDSLKCADTLALLGTVHFAIGNSEKSVRVYLKCLRRFREFHGPNHPRTKQIEGRLDKVAKYHDSMMQEQEELAPRRRP